MVGRRCAIRGRVESRRGIDRHVMELRAAVRASQHLRWKGAISATRTPDSSFTRAPLGKPQGVIRARWAVGVGHRSMLVALQGP